MDLTEKTIESIRMKPNHGKHSKNKKHHERSAVILPTQNQIDEAHQHKITKIRYIGVEFDPAKIDDCEKKVNEALSQGYEPIRDVETARGIVMVMGLWKCIK